MSGSTSSSSCPSRKPPTPSSGWVRATGDTAITADTIDGEEEIIYCRDPATQLLKSRPTSAMGGGFPMLSPGPNALTMFGGLAGGGQITTDLGSDTADRPDIIAWTR